ncbi:MAG: protein phosphatase 2C domain-containing protein [Candidatus Woesearchaeota archaeon]|jgi:hypothetical protein
MITFLKNLLFRGTQVDSASPEISLNAQSEGIDVLVNQIRKPKGYSSPLSEYQPHLVLAPNNSKFALDREILNYQGTELEITSTDNALLLRAGTEGLYRCEDYGGVVLGRSDLAKGAVICDGIGSLGFSQIVAYEVVERLLYQIGQDSKVDINPEYVFEIFNQVISCSELSADSMLVSLEEAIKEGKIKSGFEDLAEREKKILKSDKGLGATTALGVIIEEDYVHLFMSGDGGYSLVRDHSVESYGDLTASHIAPLVLGISKQGWQFRSESADDSIYYTKLPYSKGDVVALFTDGCLKNGYESSTKIGEVLFGLRKEYSSNQLRELGLALFQKLVPETHENPLVKGTIPRIEDDTTLLLIRL